MPTNKPIAVGEYPQYANKGKQNKLLTLLKEYRKTAHIIAKYQWSVLFAEAKFDRYADIKHIQSKLSERYKQTCLWQVVSLLESWTSNLANRFRQIVINLTIKTAFRVGFFGEEELFLDMLEDRNLTSHIFSEEESRKVFERIKDIYTGVLEEFIKNIQNFL